jgi:hypothetical protein
MNLPRLTYSVTDEEVKRMISKARNADARVKMGEISISPYAIQCARHGLVILSYDEYFKYEEDLMPTMACPRFSCSCTGYFDRGAALTWNHKAKKFLFAYLFG